MHVLRSCMRLRSQNLHERSYLGSNKRDRMPESHGLRKLWVEVQGRVQGVGVGNP